MVVFMGFLAFVFALFGMFLRTGRDDDLLTGINQLPEEEKEEWDISGASRFMGSLMYAFSLCLLLLGAGDVLGKDWLSVFGALLFVVLFILAYIRVGLYKKR